MRLLFASLLFTSPLFAQTTDSAESALISAVRTSQNFMASGDFAQADKCLVDFERTAPKARDFPLFCYQRFFVALNGHGNRSLAREFLSQLTAHVHAGTLSADSAEFQSVTSAWYRDMQFTDSDLPRQSSLKFADRLAAAHP